MTTRIPPAEFDSVSEKSKCEWLEQVRDHGRMTNMKRTLAHSDAALTALMQWYPLRDRVAEFLGDRAAVVFAFAVSEATDCLICSTFFRRILVERGEDPDKLQLSQDETILVALGRSLASSSHQVPDPLWNQAAQRWNPKQLVELVAFAGLMVATNLFNNAVGVDLDSYLHPFRKEAPHGS